MTVIVHSDASCYAGLRTVEVVTRRHGNVASIG